MCATRRILLPLWFLCLIPGCGGNDGLLVVHNSSWPDGTSVSIISGNDGCRRTTLYGKQIRLTFPGRGPFLLRVSSRAHLAFLSEGIHRERGTVSYTLPPPVPRRRIGGWRLGLRFSDDMPDSLYARMLENAHASMTTISPRLLGNPDLPELVRLAHGFGVEVTAVVSMNGKGGGDALSLADSAGVYGVDGVVLRAGDGVSPGEDFGYAVREWAAAMHGRGMTCGVMLTVLRGYAGNLLPGSLERTLTDAPEPERPDELRLIFAADGPAFVVPAELVEETAAELAGKRIPLSRLSAELPLTAGKLLVRDDGGLEPLPVEPGELMSLLGTSGEYGKIRLRDGSLRLGARGFLFVFGDCEETSRKIESLRKGMFSRAGGVHVFYDGRGIAPEPGHFHRFAVSAGLPR